MMKLGWCHLTYILLLVAGASQPSHAVPVATVVPGAAAPPGVAIFLRELLGRVAHEHEADPLYEIVLGSGVSARCDTTLPGPGSGATAEGFTVRAVAPDKSGANSTLLCVSGNPLNSPKARYSIGIGYGAFALLERLGFAFLHPLDPTIPDVLSPLPENFSLTEAGPRYDFRAFHIHTEHPLEMLDLLQGMDAVVNDTLTVSWDTMHPEFVRWCGWALANRVNRVEWVLLTSPDMQKSGFVNSTLRRARLRNLTSTARSFGLLSGADVPIIEIQQHGWYMVKNPSSDHLEDAKMQIRERLDWLLSSGEAGAGFDYLNTESGFTEFTSPNCTLMLELINTVSDYANETHAARSYIKCHCSTGQVCKDYPDPREPSQPINFNFLPHYASATMGVLPHTIQVYALDDPTAGTYGNLNFSDMFHFLLGEAQEHQRDVVFHPETNYWVNVDIDVPLLLPLYGQRRLHDLRIVDAAERAAGLPQGSVAGQNIFDSGWEWGAWLSDVVAARAAWDPLADESNSTRAFFLSLEPLSRALGSDRVAEVVVRIALAQQRLLVEGRVDSAPRAPTPEELAGGLGGAAYLSGMDSWTELLALVKPHAVTQPRRVRFRDHGNPLYPRVAPLLDDMNRTFGDLASELEELLRGGGWNEPAVPLLEDLADSARMLALRADHTKRMYMATAPGVTGAQRAAILNSTLRDVIYPAAALVQKREQAYRLQPAARIAGWRPNPTAYSFGYLWTVHSLYYFWRDFGIVQRGGADAWVEPCYLNMQDISDVGLGWGKDLSDKIRAFLEKIGIVGDMLGTCLAPPAEPYVFPRDLYRY